MQRAYVYGVMLSFMALDILSGVIKTLRQKKKLSSSKMSTGLFKKTGNIVCMVSADLFSEFAPLYGLPEINVFTPVCAYIIIMEIISIYENVGETGLLSLIKKLIGRNGNNENK